MFKKLKSLFEAPSSSEIQDESRLAQLAAAALLIELSHADHNVDVSETQAILAIVSKTLNLSSNEIDVFFSEAETRKDSATSLYEFTDIINQQFDKDAKFQLICDLWRVAYADGKIDRYEDHTIRKVAELIYVSHSDFIRAKHRVKEN